jgi:hypothetical protein
VGTTSGSSGSSECPGQVPYSTACSVAGQVCHYQDPSLGGTVDCGCEGGAWGCYSGCSPSSPSYAINSALCQPQLQSTTTCHPYGPVCGFSVAVPCLGDAGSPLDLLDAGSGDCAAWCKAVAPPGFPGLPGGYEGCRGVTLVDGGADAGPLLILECSLCGA